MPSLPRSRLQSSATPPQLGPSGFETGDLLMTGLNSAGDISVKVVSCREVVQESILRNDLSTQSGQVLGEVMACTLMMGAGFKGEETLQVNLVGGPQSGIRNVMCISDGELKVRGLVGRPRFTTGTQQPKTRDLFGDDGQIQIVRNHPSWRQPNTGIVALRGSASVSLNLALYMTESEQRSAFMLTDVKVEGNLCRHALGICVERLPGATEENIEQSIKNVEMVEKKGLRSYLKQNSQDVVMLQGSSSEFRDFAPVLDKVIDDCFENMGCELRWTKAPRFRCSCGVDRVWRTLRLLSKEDVVSILDEPENAKSVAFTCEFCNTKFALSREEIIEELRL